MFDPTLIEPRSFIPGRVRVAVRGLRGNSKLADNLKRRIIALPGVREVRPSLYSGTLLVTYDEGQTYPARFLAVAYCLSQEHSTGNSCDTYTHGQHHGASFAPALQATVSGGALAYLFWRKITRGTATTADSAELFALATVTTLVSGYPVLQRGFRALSKRGRVNGDVLLVAASIALSLVRGNALGLLALFLVQLSYALQAHSSSDARLPLSAVPDVSLLGNFSLACSALALAAGQPQLALAAILAGNPAPLQHARGLPIGSLSRQALREGIVVRHPQRFATLAKADVVLFNASAIFGKSNPTVIDAVPIDPRYSQRDILASAALVAQFAPHTFAHAILSQAKEQRIVLHKAVSHQSTSNGAVVTMQGERLLLGNDLFMEEHQVSLKKSSEAVRALKLIGARPIYLARNDKLIGLIACKDSISPDSENTIAALKALGVRHVGVLSADRTSPGPEECARAGISAVWEGLSPDDKAYIVRTIKKHGYKVAVVGVGTSDLPAMAESDVGVAITPPDQDANLPHFDLTVTNGGHRKVATATYLSRRMLGLTTQNRIVATTTGLLGIGLALLGRIPVKTAAMLPHFASLSMVANSSRYGLFDWGLPSCGAKRQRKQVEETAQDCVVATHHKSPPLSHSWHALVPDKVLSLLGSDPTNGLTQSEVATRLAANGDNTLPVRQQTSPWHILWDQFNDPMVRILLGAAGFSVFLGHPRSALITLGVVLFNAVVGTWQELQNCRSLEMLQRLVAPTTTVQRNGTTVRVPSSKVVPGDILILEAGDRVPADARIIEAHNLQADEAPLTGESLPASKQVLALDLSTAVADRKNMLYMGTIITRGRGKAVVVSTSAHTEVGRISTLMNNNMEVETPLKRSLSQLARYVTNGCLAISGFILAAGLWRGSSLLEMLMLGTSLAVAAIPEGLASAVTIALAIGVQRMVKKGILIRKLPALETLGCTTVICSDKTGTLTKNEMTVRTLYVAGSRYAVTGEGYRISGHFELVGDGHTHLNPTDDAPLLEALRIALHCNNAYKVESKAKTREVIVRGDPTESALLVAALKGGLRTDDESGRRIFEVPFESVNRRMSVVCEMPTGQRVSYTKGAVDVILPSSTHILTRDGIRPITPADRDAITQENNFYASKAMRVLALATKTVGIEDEVHSPNDICEGLTFVGLAGLIDPPRSEVYAALAKCKQAGIRVIMITGDQPLTAQAIASELGIVSTPDGIMTGAELDSLDDTRLSEVVKRVAVFARTTPQHKLRIVCALKQLGHVVAMTGDGVNDGPALKAAHIGIAMGSGTEVSKEASALVVSDDNFATIVTGIEEGRAVYSNIRKAIRYLLATNAGEVVAMALATLAGLPAPLTALQLLWVNLLGDGLPAIALINDPPSKQAMQSPPRNASDGVLAHGLGKKILQRGVIVGLTSLWVFRQKLAIGATLPLARTLTLATLTIGQFIHLFDVRADRTLGGVSVFSNYWLIAATLASLGLLVALIQMPLLQGLIGTTSLSLGDWTFAMLVAGMAAMFDLTLNRFASPKAVLKPA